MKKWLSDDYQGSMEGFSMDWELEFMNYGVLPDQPLEVGDTFNACAGLRQSGLYHGLELDLLKQKNGWKVQAYRFRPNEE